MSSVLSLLPIALVFLVCPLMMIGIGAAAWVTARARGEKKPMSLGCMTGHGSGDTPSADPDTEPQLRDRVVKMEQEVTELRAKLQTGATASSDAHGSQDTLPASQH